MLVTVRSVPSDGLATACAQLPKGLEPQRREHRRDQPEPGRSVT